MIFHFADAFSNLVLFVAYSAAPTYKWLTSSGIYPSNNQTYTLDQLEGALARHHGGKTPFLGCSNNGTRLNEFWYYYNTFGSVIGGTYVPVDSTTKSTCKESGIQWLPK